MIAQPHDGLLLSIQKQRGIGVSHNRGASQSKYAEWEPNPESSVGFHLCKILKSTN